MGSGYNIPKAIFYLLKGDSIGIMEKNMEITTFSIIGDMYRAYIRSK